MDKGLINLLKKSFGGVANGAFIRGFAFHRIAAPLANKYRFRLRFFTGLNFFQSFLIQRMMDYLHLVGPVEADFGLAVFFRLTLSDKAGVHIGKLIMFTAHSLFQIIRHRPYAVQTHV